MSPKRTITTRDLTTKNTSSEVDAIFQKAIKGAYHDQQALLKKAKKLQNNK